MTIEEIKEGLRRTDISQMTISYAVFAALSLNKPILIEGDPGVGKTSLAIAVAKMLGLPFLRLQMYDGLTKDDILYDYDYQRQLLTLEAVKPKINEEIKDMDVNSAIRKVAGDVNFYGKEFLIPRPVLQTINGTGRKLLLIDEIDKSSEETEYMLYEYLEGYGINIPQLGPVNCRKTRSQSYSRPLTVTVSFPVR
ncbi:MAG: AAA family ATPase [Blautia hansenii]